MNAEQQVHFDTQGPVGVITMTRPKALNALTLEMIEEMAPKLEAWERDPDIKAVAIRGEGEKAFCAGGDVRAVWEAGRAAKADGSFERGKRGLLTGDFFRAEYALNRQIERFSKPYIALINGITMGGGVGLSVHGHFRIAGERTMVAMPETAIGLFPDVGGSWFLPRLPGKLGVFIALTGERLKAADALYAGVATHFVPDERYEKILPALADADWSGDPEDVVDGVLHPLTDSPEPSALAEQRDAIDRCFNSEHAEAIFEALANASSDFLAERLERLHKFSPTSIKIALKQLAEGARLTFDECMIMEYRMSQACMDGHDFYEGIRAVLIDRDHEAKWDPAALSGVDEARVEDHFRPLGENDLAFER
jgi:enoyl-CoA hydratase